MRVLEDIKLLRNLQENFLDDISCFSLNKNLNNKVYDQEIDYLNSLINLSQLNQSQRLKIYFNNSLMARIKSLMNTFPVAVNLLGEECFRALAKSYIDHHHSKSSTLNNEGGYFLEFVRLHWEDFSTLHSLVYLQDVLQLEWYIHQSLWGPNNSTFNFQALASVSKMHYSKVVFCLAQNGFLISSDFPIDTIWEVNQNENKNHNSEELINLDETVEPVRLFVWRPDWDLHLRRLTPEEWSLLVYIQRGKLFSEIQDLLGLRLEKQLLQLINMGCITTFKLI